MKLLIDTNVVLDYLGANVGFASAAKEVFDLAVEKKAVELVSASAITDIYYVMRRATGNRDEAAQKLRELRKVIHILPVTEYDIDKALSRNWKDFEDAVQYSVAESNHVDYIITRNEKDFEERDIPCYSPELFMKEVILADR